MKTRKRRVLVLHREGLFKCISAWGVLSNIAVCIVVFGVAAVVFCVFLRYQTFGIGAVLPWYSTMDAYGYDSLQQIENRSGITSAYSENMQEEAGNVTRQYDEYLLKANEQYRQVMEACRSAENEYRSQHPDLFIDSSFVQNQGCLIWKLMFYKQKKEEFNPVSAKQTFDLLTGLVGSQHIQDNININAVGFLINGDSETSALMIRSIQSACSGLGWNKDVYFQLVTSEAKEGEEVQQKNAGYEWNIIIYETI